MDALEKMPVVVLCGGLGTRLRPVVAEVPKVLAPVAERPFLGYLLDHLRGQGVREVVLSTGYRGDLVRAYAGDGARWGVQVRYAEEPEPLGTGGALRFTAEAVGLHTSFFVMNGDTFFSGSLGRLARFHRERSEAIASMALVRVERPDRYGTVALEPERGRVVGFAEKQLGHEGGGWINAGVYVLEPELIADIPAGRKSSLEGNVFPRWIDQGLYGCPFEGAVFLDIGTPEDYARAPAVLKAE